MPVGFVMVSWNVELQPPEIVAAGRSGEISRNAATRLAWQRLRAWAGQGSVVIPATWSFG
jgi:hypothetical protein